MAHGVAVVLGAGPGLGLSLCKLFRGKGLVVAAASRSGAPAAHDAAIKSFTCDAADEASVVKFVQEAEAACAP